jgi:hypothetical protein
VTPDVPAFAVPAWLPAAAPVVPAVSVEEGAAAPVLRELVQVSEMCCTLTTRSVSAELLSLAVVTTVELDGLGDASPLLGAPVMATVWPTCSFSMLLSPCSDHFFPFWSVRVKLSGPPFRHPWTVVCPEVLLCWAVWSVVPEGAVDCCAISQAVASSRMSVNSTDFLMCNSLGLPVQSSILVA